MKQKHLRVAYGLAPIICQETAGTADQRYQDYFCRVDYDGDRQANNNWDNLPQFRDRLVPEVYCAILETQTHYFALYSVFHPRDWKPVQGHENDMEHAQVVARKKANGEVVEYVCTNAHSWNSVYYNPDLVDVTDLSRTNREMLYDGPIMLHNGRPVVYIQPGTGPLLELLGQVGHGIQGVVDRPGSRWKGDTSTYEFENNQGLVCVPNRQPSAPPNSQQAVHLGTQYSLIPTDETLWKWRTEIDDAGLYAPKLGRWKADTQQYQRGKAKFPTRKAFFESKGLATEVVHPAAFVGNEGVKDAAHPPFAFTLSVPWWMYLLAVGRDPGWVAKERKHNALIDQGLKPLDNFFDPAHSWFVRLGAPTRWSTDYESHSYVK